MSEPPEAGVSCLCPAVMSPASTHCCVVVVSILGVSLNANDGKMSVTMLINEVPATAATPIRVVRSLIAAGTQWDKMLCRINQGFSAANTVRYLHSSTC